MTPQDRAREAADDAWHALCEKDDRTSPADYPDHCLITCDELRQAMEQYHATILAAVLEGADEKIAEITKYTEKLREPIETPNMGKAFGEIATKNNIATANMLNHLLTLVTALSAKLKEVERKLARHVMLGHIAAKALNLTTDELTAQKAAHAKLLRDEASRIEAFNTKEDWFGRRTAIATEIRRLADKIEAGNG